MIPRQELISRAREVIALVCGNAPNLIAALRRAEHCDDGDRVRSTEDLARALLAEIDRHKKILLEHVRQLKAKGQT